MHSVNIRQARIDAGFRLSRDFAQRIGVNHLTWREIESGRKRLSHDMACRAAPALRRSPAWLLGLPEPEPKVIVVYRDRPPRRPDWFKLALAVVDVARRIAALVDHLTSILLPKAEGARA